MVVLTLHLFQHALSVCVRACAWIAYPQAKVKIETSRKTKVRKKLSLPGRTGSGKWNIYSGHTSVQVLEIVVSLAACRHSIFPQVRSLRTQVTVTPKPSIGEYFIPFLPSSSIFLSFSFLSVLPPLPHTHQQLSSLVVVLQVIPAHT